ncbi:MAG: hypothetical protein G01um101419_585 [Parcubacteria group bacterium Gr01-1014_19]|nr:MAG: hypothetical protein G01um101419_585 [Parcubacteria group bacterium Gr01-1014_19]
MKTYRFRIQIEGFSWQDVEVQAPSVLAARMMLTEQLKRELPEDKNSWADYLAMRATFTESSESPLV